MFKMGGAAEGITSGLDKPRQQYNLAGRVLPTQEEFQQAQAMFPQLVRPQGESLNRFLTTFGLDLLSRPPQGGTLATIAAAAKGPTEQLFEDMETDRATKFATDADLFKTLIEAKADAAGGTSGKTYAKLEIAGDIERTMQEIINLNEQIKLDPENEGLKNQLDQKQARLTYLSKENTTGKALMQNTDFTEKVLKGIINTLKDETIPDPKNPGQTILKYPEGKNDPLLLKEAYRQFYKFFEKVPEAEEENLATGGRVGLQMGSKPPAMAQEPDMSQTPKIDFDTLRARLPKEITDDIVRLIAQSPEALEDFATIATQQDVDQFNTKYSVDLVLPQEA